jgi:hypothetical protein
MILRPFYEGLDYLFHQEDQKNPDDKPKGGPENGIGVYAEVRVVIYDNKVKESYDP